MSLTFATTWNFQHFTMKGEQIFGRQPKQNQYNYSETNEEVETDETILKTFLEGFHTVDVTSGDYKNIVNGVNAAM